jgi:hypothetical protein
MLRRNVEPDPGPDGEADGQQVVRPDPIVSTTVGTGSMLGLGCVVIVILLVLVALAIRRFGGGW